MKSEANFFGLLGLAAIIAAFTPSRLVDDFFSARQVEPMSSLRFSERNIRQKPVNAGEVSRGSVTIENIGKHAITDVSVMANCSCSAAVLSKTAIQPGKKLHIDFSIDTKGRSGDVLNTFVFCYTENGQRPYDVFYVTVPVLALSSPQD